MSVCNFEWIKSIIQDSAVIFDIGAANLHESVTMRRLMPNAKIFAFECGSYWLEYSSKVASQYNIHYNNCAVSDITGKIKFYPSEILDDKVWPWSGSTCKPEAPLLTEQWQWGAEYEVDAITLNDFCKQHLVVPDFIHVDAQGGEYKIFKDLNMDLRPKIIWTEMSEFSRYNSGTTHSGFIEMMSSKGYKEAFIDSCDSLFVRTDVQIPPYIKS